MSDWPTQPDGLAGATDRVTPALRWWEGIAALVSGGLVVIGLVLVGLQLLAPSLGPGTGLGAATGPGWGVAGAQLCVGVLGEILVAIRTRCPRWLRWSGAGVVLVCAAGVLYAVWWA